MSTIAKRNRQLLINNLAIQLSEWHLTKAVAESKLHELIKELQQMKPTNSELNSTNLPFVEEYLKI